MASSHDKVRKFQSISTVLYIVSDVRFSCCLDRVKKWYTTGAKVPIYNLQIRLKWVQQLLAVKAYTLTCDPTRSACSTLAGTTALQQPKSLPLRCRYVARPRSRCEQPAHTKIQQTENQRKPGHGMLDSRVITVA